MRYGTLKKVHAEGDQSIDLPESGAQLRRSFAAGRVLPSDAEVHRVASAD